MSDDRPHGGSGPDESGHGTPGPDGSGPGGSGPGGSGPAGSGPNASGPAADGSGPDQGPAFSLTKGETPDGGQVTYGYGPPSYGDAPAGAGAPGDGPGGQATGHDAGHDPSGAHDPSAPHGPGVPYDPNVAYDPAAGHAPGVAYDPAAGNDPNAGHDPNAGYGGPPTGYPAGPSPYGAPSSNAGPNAGPNGGPTPWGTPAPTKKHTGLIVGLIAGGLVLVLAVVGGIVLIATRGGGDKPSATVQAYLDALASGNAATALNQGRRPPDTSFVTNAALKKQQAIAKISDVKVSEGYSTSRSARVSATYRFGDKQADESFSLTKTGGKWKLDDTVYPIDLSSINDVPGLTLLGIDASSKSKAYVFPGPLTWGSTNKYLSVKASDAADFTLSPSDGSFSYSTLETSLSTKGEKAVADAVGAFLSTCAASKSLAPDNCPQAEYDYQGVEGSATWTPPADLSGLQYQSSNPATKVYVTGDLTWSVTYSADDGTGAQKPVTKNDVDGSVYGTVDLAQNPPTFSQ